jgi:DNA polymerase elongation subunit (family B)
MTRIFLDIETYSPGHRPTYNDKVIAIAYKQEGGPITVLKEWESDEKQILNQFLEEIQRIDRPNIIGHNILRFDLPVIINRASFHNIADTGDLMHLLLDAYPIDTIQTLLPQNNFYFKGIGLADCAKRIGVETKTCPSSEILTKYQEGDHEAITEHVTEDVLTTEKLFNTLLGK